MNHHEDLQPEDLRREIKALRDRLLRLSEASLRTTGSLDPDTVLQDVLDRARSLADARYGGITTLVAEGRLLEEPVRNRRARITQGVGEEEWAAFAATVQKILPTWRA